MPLSLSRTCERRLLAAIRHGNATTYTKIVELIYPPLVTYATAFTQSSFDAEEIVQNILTRLWQGRRQLVVESLRGYLRQAVRNGVFDHHRRQQRRKDLNGEQVALPIARVPPDQPCVLGGLITQEMEDVVVTLLRTMPERWRSVFLLCAVEGYTQLEASRVLGLSRSRINLYLQYARHAIAVHLRHHGFHLPQSLQMTDSDMLNGIPSHAYLPLRNPKVRVMMTSAAEWYDPSHPFSSIRVRHEPIPAECIRKTNTI